MGLFSGPSKDSADKKFQAALDAINGVKAPTVEEQKIQLEQLVQQGIITPEEMQTYLQEDSGMADINIDPRFRQAQVGALTQLQDIATEGGLTATDRARMQDIFDAQNAEERGQREAIEQNARERGIGGSDFMLASKLISNQEGANRAARQGMDVAALAEQRALEAMIRAGELGGNIDQQEFEQQAKIKAAQDAVNQFNTATRQQVAGVNVGARNTAQQLNLGESQRIADTNTTNTNINRERDANLIQQKFQNEMDKARAAAGIYGQWGTNEQAAANSKYGAQMGAFGTALTGAATLGAGALASDVMNKEEIAPADVDLDEFMVSLQPYKYKYKDKAKHGDGEQHGVMAQDMAKTKTGAAIVKQTPDGLVIDTNKGFGVLAAAIGRLNKKLEEKA